MTERLTRKGQRGQLSRAAEALNCQRSYLSRVITEDLHITPDHAFNLAQFWKLTTAERRYFQTLVDYERAADPNYRADLLSTLKELKKQHQSVQERTQRTALSVDALQVGYFSSWLWSALHFLTSIPNYQKTELIADRLGVKSQTLQPYLEQLEAGGLIEKQRDRWIYKSGEFHAPKDSPLVVLHHQNWRQRAILDAQDFQNTNVHFTGVYTVSQDDAERIKELLLKFIEDSNAITGPSEPEELVALTCDFFKV